MNRLFLQLFCTILGFVIGYTVLHPYAMLDIASEVDRELRKWTRDEEAKA